MARVARIVADNAVVHVFARGNNRQDVFHRHADYDRYLDLLDRYRRRFPTHIYHYCLMPNHVHLVVQVEEGSHLASFMKGVTLGYSRYHQGRYGYVGHLWQGRFRSVLIDQERYLLACGLYVERNPVRAGLADSPDAYAYSSYRFYALGDSNRFLEENPLYHDLGATREARRQAYREAYLTREREAFIKDRIDRGRFLGSLTFVQQAQARFGVRELRRRPGRPPKR